MKNLNITKATGRSPASSGSGLRCTSWFFDAPAVVNAVDKATRKTLSRFGAYVRRTMKSSIRKRKRISEPGSPPSSHSGLLKKFIFFSFDPTSRSVVIGPEKLNAKIGVAPKVLEHGGKNVIATYRRRKVVGKRSIRVKARPFARRALMEELPKLPAMWRDSVRSTH